jgi:hypothetical protein
MWVFSICAPSVFYFSIEDPSLMVSMNASEEEPGEGEKQDCLEESKALTETQHLRLITQADKKISPLQNPVTCLEIVSEVVLPPPEKSPFSQPVFFCNV